MHGLSSKVKSVLGFALTLGLFGTALWALHRQLAGHHYRDVLRTLREMPLPWVAAALGLTILDYLALSGYDALALRYVRKPLALGRTVLASFVGYAFSHSLGFTLFTGAPVRFRLYTAWGLSGIEVTQIVGFCAATFWLGFAAMAGVAFVIAPTWPAASSLASPFALRAFGLCLLALVACYLLLSTFRRRPLQVRRFEFEIPGPHIALAQLAVGCIDWGLAAAVLFALLPPEAAVSYPAFLRIFLLAQIAGVASQVPGGLGVFEGTLLLLLAGAAPAARLLASLLAFRVLYYLLPLTAATVLLGATEALRHRGRLQRFGAAATRWLPAVVPHVFAVGAFVAGAVLLVSGATPSLEWRLRWLNDLLPLPVLEVSHLLASLIGLGLLILARGLRNRLDAAYALTVGLLTAGAVLSLLKGLDYEEAAVLGILALALLPCRSHFYRRGSLFEQPFSPRWVLAVLVVFGAASWFWFFSQRRGIPSSEMALRFELLSHGARSLRATAAALGALGLFGLSRVLKPAPPPEELPGPDDLEDAGRIAAASSDTTAYLALLGDKELLFDESRTAFLMYGVEGRSWIVLGDPVGPEPEARELAWRFRELSDRHRGWTAFYEVSTRHLPLYLDLGLTLIKLGEEAHVRLTDFSLAGGARKTLRNAHTRAEREGCTFEVIPAAAVPPLLPELGAVSDDWLAAKGTREKGFSLGFFSPEYLQRFPLALVRREDRLVAFANLWPAGDGEELSVDLMRYTRDAPPGLMDYLFVELMLWGGEQGYRWFTLGMAPLSGLDSRALAPLWNRVGAFLFRHGEQFYNFQGVRTFKEKFDPVWQPRYLASPGGLVLPRVLANVAALIAGGLKGVVAK